jgi:L-2-hydroxyglutarate oxidase LhgO
VAETLDCVVIGAGVVGLAIARELALAGREVVIVEAEHAIGSHTSSRNSGVIHAGIYYATGSLKAQLCVAGRKALYEYCAERGIAHKRVGKLVVACDEAQLTALDAYRRQAQINGVDDLRMIAREELNELEPEVQGVAAFLSPSTGIVDAHALMLAYLGDAENLGATLAHSSPVLAGRVKDGSIELEIGGAEPMRALCRVVVNSAGLNAPAVARSIDGVNPLSIPGAYYAIGRYYSLIGKTPFKRLVYPIARQDWLGVHVTLELDGRCKFGPDFTWIERPDYAFDDSHREAFYMAIRRYFPGLKDGSLQPGYTGIRPRVDGPGTPGADFMIHGPKIHGVAGLVNLYGIESPGLTSSLAIASQVRSLLEL